ncbi:hypothetical protein SteCoe_32891 [Stentor coeruleus]|uniref:E3 ubiquitin protein ligase n=1 Tax=Stentor coeruleus TaxID=5963 RepID=A0A1R2AXZ0_9CILI|nr:hypothetical protein SteCoe_32891 [Stentor coeruleus]
MSDGDPYKRQKTSEDSEIITSEENNLMYQNACLSSRLKDQRKQISELTIMNEQLNSKVLALEETLNSVNSNWAKTLSNINVLCAELTVPPEKINPFEIFIQEAPGIEPLTEMTKKCIYKLLEAIDKVAEYESGVIVENCRAELQTNEILSENMKLKQDLKRYIDEVTRLQDTVTSLSTEKATLSIRLIRKGDYKIDNQSSDKTNENIDEIKNQRDTLEKMYIDESKKYSQIKYQKEVSHERIIRSKAFKDLIDQAKILRDKLKDYKERANYLSRYKDDHKEILRSKCEGIIEKEYKKRQSLENEIKSLQKKMVLLEKEKNENLFELDTMRAMKNDKSTGNHFTELIDSLNKDKETLKVKNSALQKTIEELNKKIYDYEMKGIETSQEPENIKFLKIIDDYKQKLKNEQAMQEKLYGEIGVAEDAYEKIEEKMRNLALQLVEQEKLYNKLMNEKVRESAWKGVHNKEKLAYEEKIKSLEELIVSHEALHKAYEGQLKIKDNLIADMGNKCKEIETKTKHTVENFEEGILRSSEMAGYKKYYIESLKRSQEIVSRLTEDKVRLTRKNEELRKENILLEEKSKSEKDLNNVKSADELLNAEVAVYRKMIKCSVCCVNTKDIILSKCLHTFCKVCLNEQLASRKRKCPLCKIRFSADDMKNFWWENT